MTFKALVLAALLEPASLWLHTDPT